MLHDLDLPTSLWAKATRTVVYIQNRCPHAILGEKTPEEAFTGEKSDVSHLRIFGCPVYIHIPKEKRTKMEPFSKKGIFMGYSETSKAYRIYIPGQRNIEVSKDVTFHEEAAFKRSKDIQINVEMEEGEIPSDRTPDLGPSSLDTQRASSVEQFGSIGQEDQIERSLKEPQVKRKPTWCKEILQEVEKHGAPADTFRESKRPHKYSGYVTQMTRISTAEPSSFEEAAKQHVWEDAMMEEYQSILKNDVWDIVPRPEGKSIVSSKWIYKIKHFAEGSIEKYKARFVARGFSQKEGIDYDETFAPIARYTSIRTIISLATILGWKLHQMDVKTAFLNGQVEEEVYIEQPDGFVVQRKESHVCKLRKTLYGLKQAPGAWYAKIDSYLQNLGFSKSVADPNLYFKVEGNHPLFLVLYVDDLFLTREEQLIVRCKRELSFEFEMKYLGLMHYFLGLEVWPKPNGIFLSQGKYTVDVLQRFGMLDCKSMSTPMVSNLKKLHESNCSSDSVDPTLYRQLIGSLIYLVHTRPDICKAVHTLSQFMSDPRHRHWIVAKHILRYLKGSISFGLWYISTGGVSLHGFVDSDWVGSPVDRKSTCGYRFNLGSAMVSWSSRK